MSRAERRAWLRGLPQQCCRPTAGRGQRRGPPDHGADRPAAVLRLAPDVNAVEGFFAKLTRRRLKRGVFRSIVDLQAAINRFIEEVNGDPKPFVWTANPDKIIAAVKRAHQALE